MQPTLIIDNLWSVVTQKPKLSVASMSNGTSTKMQSVSNVCGYMWKHVKHEINKIPCTTCFISTALIDSIEICKQRSVWNTTAMLSHCWDRTSWCQAGQDSEHHQQQKHSEPRLQDVGHPLKMAWTEQLWEELSTDSMVRPNTQQ